VAGKSIDRSILKRRLQALLHDTYEIQPIKKKIISFISNQSSRTQLLIDVSQVEKN